MEPQSKEIISASDKIIFVWIKQRIHEAEIDIIIKQIFKDQLLVKGQFKMIPLFMVVKYMIIGASITVGKNTTKSQWINMVADVRWQTYFLLPNPLKTEPHPNLEWSQTQLCLDTCLILFCSLFIFASVQYLLSTHSTYTFFICTIYSHFTQLILYSFNNNNNILPWQ